MNIDWRLVGQVLTCWFAAGFVAAPYIGRALRRRRIQRARIHFRETKKVVVLNRAELVKATQSDLKDSAYQERARRAEALGFQDDDESGPWVEPQRKAQ